MKSYKNYLRAIGRKPVDPAKLRTVKKPGDIEIAWRAGEYVGHRHEEAA